MQLCAKSMNQRRWAASVIPVTEVEIEQSQTAVTGERQCIHAGRNLIKEYLGYGKEGSVWHDKIDKVTNSLRKWVTVYSMAVTELPGGTSGHILT